MVAAEFRQQAFRSTALTARDMEPGLKVQLRFMSAGEGFTQLALECRKGGRSTHASHARHPAEDAALRP